MLLAVNMPEHEPQDGQAKSSSIFKRLASILPAWKAPTPSNTVDQVDRLASRGAPGRHGPAAKRKSPGC